MPLITASDLLARLATIRLLDARPDPADFQAGHLPGACHASLEKDLSTAWQPDHDPAKGGRHPLPPVPRFAARLGAWGITPAPEVVVYDAAGGGNAAARAWWMLRALGHPRVSVLDGGLAAALAAGLALVTNDPPPPPAPAYPADRWHLPTVAAAAVAALRTNPSWKLLDARSAERWRGETEPFDPLAGRIPGSLNLPWPQTLGPDGRFLSAEDLRNRFQTLLQGTPPERVAVHCGSGVTACHTLLAMEVAGLSGAALYVGSWSEWCRSDRPKAGTALPTSATP